MEFILLHQHDDKTHPIKPGPVAFPIHGLDFFFFLDEVIEMADGIEVEDLPQFPTRRELMEKHRSQGISTTLPPLGQP